MKYLDISPPISAKTAVFPGDQPFARTIALDFNNHDNLLLSSIQTSLHIGAHADAPNHYHPAGGDIATRPLDYYLGPCQVIWVDLPAGRRILPGHLADKPITAKRVLFRTNSFPDPTRWNSDFNSVSPELIDYLADRGVCLVGIDTPSVDPEQSKILESHQAVYRRDLAILEGLVLTEVPEGEYYLVALPLRLEGADASPVRAILITDRSLPHLP